MLEIIEQLQIQASRERVYQALTTAEGIRNWWTSDATLETGVGGVGEFGFFNHQSITKVRVEELVAPVRVNWQTIASFRPEWAGTTITFELSEEGSNNTLLSFAHRGFLEADEGYALTAKGWAYYLVSLQHYLETGKGAPR